MHLLILPLLLATAAAPSIEPEGSAPPPAQAPAHATEGVAALDLSAALGSLVKQHDVPALGVCVVREGRVVAHGVAGVRARPKAGAGVPVTNDDLWHVGSISKSMTATLCARLVERGDLRFEQTLAESFPELKDRLHPRFAPVTLHQLLMHRGGVEGGAPPVLWLQLMDWKGSLVEARQHVVESLLTLPPDYEPGTLPGGRLVYSNLGVVIAGHIAEHATGRAWEDLIREHVFEPLGMRSAGFGAPGARGEIDQPRGHREGGAPVPPGKAADNPQTIAPAGTVHASLEDVARFGWAHLQGERGQGSFLRPDTWKTLHQPLADGPYACGLVARPAPWSGAPALWHNGTNTKWYAELWIVPSEGLVVATACNQFGPGKQAVEAASLAAARAVLGLTQTQAPTSKEK